MTRLRALSAVSELIVGLAAVVVFLIWAAADGGYPPESWYPGALFLLGLLALAGYFFRERWAALSPAHRLGIGLLAAFAAWSYLSIAWAEVDSIAWEGANRTLLYAIVLALFSVLPWRPRTAGVALGVYSLGLAGIGLIVVAGATGADADLALIGSRFAEPTGYPNAVAALFIGGFWAAIHLAGRRQAPWPGRAAALAAAGVLLELALLPESRGALIVFPISLAVFVAVSPARLRLLLMMVPVAVAVGLSAPTVLDVFSTAESGGDVGAAIAATRDAMLLSALGLAAVGALLALGDSRVEVSERAGRALRRGVAALGAVAVAVAVVAALIAVGNPFSWADDRWQDFKGGYDTAGFGDTRFSGDLGSNRYDFWRVAISEELASAPLVGRGADNFAVDYLRYRESDEEALFPHSQPLRVLAGTGLIGGLLFAGSLVAMIVAAAGTRRRRAGPAAGLAAVALGAFVYWALHASGDWLWSFPAITAPVLAWLGIAGALGTEPGPPRGGAPWGAGARIGALAVGGIAVLAVAASFLLPWAAARDVQLATSDWRADPEAALDRLDRARDLNPLSAQADLTTGAIEVQLDDVEAARDAFARAVEREPTNWYALLELGTAEAQLGEEDAAISALGRAVELNPEDPLLAQALRRARRGNPLGFDDIEADLLGRVCAVVGATRDTRFCQ